MHLHTLRERHEAFVDHYGLHPELLKDGKGSILGRPLRVIRYDPHTNYAELVDRNRDYSRKPQIGEVREVVEFAEDSNGNAVQRSRLVEGLKRNGGIIKSSSRVVMIYQSGQGYVKWTAFETGPKQLRDERLAATRGSLTLEYLPSLNDNLRVGMVHHNGIDLNFVTTSQVDPERAKSLHEANRYDGNQVPKGLTIVNESGKLRVYDGGFSHDTRKAFLGDLPSGVTFSHPTIDTQLDWVEIGSIRGGQIVARVWNPSTQVELLMGIPKVDFRWYSQAQGPSTGFPEIRSQYPVAFRHDRGKTSLPPGRVRS